MWHMIKKLKDSGMSISKIAKELGIGHSILLVYLKENNH
ncbi:MAG: helix-turn-helix domain-containing protein [Thermoplasmata archaeon]